MLKEVAEMESISGGRPPGGVRPDFTPDEWLTMRKAMFGAPASVALAGGRNGHMSKAMFAVTQQLLAARNANTSEMVRELADFSYFQTDLQPGMSAADVQAWLISRQQAIHSAARTVAAKAPADLPAFQLFILSLAETPARTHRWISGAEAHAIAKVKEALDV